MNADPNGAGRGSRRPIEDWEAPYLTAMGSRLRAARQAAGMGQAAVACAAGLSERSLRRIEYGVRRTRLSTLHRIVAALDLDDPADDSVLLGELRLLAGPAVAPESVYAERIERRRARRTRAAAGRFVTEHVVLHEEVPGGVLETHVHRTRKSRSGVKERRYQVLRSDAGQRHRVPALLGDTGGREDRKMKTHPH